MVSVGRNGKMWPTSSTELVMKEWQITRFRKGLAGRGDREEARGFLERLNFFPYLRQGGKTSRLLGMWCLVGN